jgi:multidrug efflux pump subunit AcrA (membrane-fusion protein)
MRCKANVHIERVGDALYVPVQAVVREGAAALVYVPAGNLYRSRQVQLGRASETFVEVLEGLIEGDVILPRPPRPEEIALPQGAVLTSTS